MNLNRIFAKKSMENNLIDLGFGNPIQWSKDRSKQYCVDGEGSAVYVRSFNNGVFGKWEKKPWSFILEIIDEIIFPLPYNI